MNNNNTYAAIDIGSNAIRLLVKKERDNCQVGQKPLTKVLLLRIPLRLGFDVFACGEIPDIKVNKLVRAIKAFGQLMKVYEVSKFRACATSAMRDAKNGKAVIKKVFKHTGIKIEIIDGQEEAALVYNNHIECMEDRSGNYIYVDVGGGSTEVNLLTNGELVFSKSYNIGTVRILSRADKPETWQQLRNDMVYIAGKYPDINIIGSGGNINKLYRLASTKDKQKLNMPVSSLEEIYKRLKFLTPEQRMDEFHLKADRADVIVPAAEVFLAIAESTGAQYIHVPVIGLADGIIDKLYAADIQEG
ncbi:MAG: Ppx/GppA family phosphatase [Bacteroidetes bacterium]|uniref:Ppx/GppA family phosphatase n=1 Tax=Candidatus Enterocola intestinipullorum TaxID=2840783 RepID=A0A9D9EHJ8_9BACT|nr:Ppx/GppA family phosphatase [Candidatus Enterocola intestinipullorum]